MEAAIFLIVIEDASTYFIFQSLGLCKAILTCFHISYTEWKKRRENIFKIPLTLPRRILWIVCIQRLASLSFSPAVHIPDFWRLSCFAMFYLRNLLPLANIWLPLGQLQCPSSYFSCETAMWSRCYCTVWKPDSPGYMIQLDLIANPGHDTSDLTIIPAHYAACWKKIPWNVLKKQPVVAQWLMRKRGVGYQGQYELDSFRKIRTHGSSRLTYTN